MQNLILPCEVGVKTVLPAVKAMMARSIVEKHGLNEKQTADLLGLSQSAVSRYVGKERGNLLLIENPEVLALIDQMVTSLIKEPDNKSGVLTSILPNMLSHQRKRFNVPVLPKRDAFAVGRKLSLLPLNQH